jgi:Flp pilus assembly pilin Flp
VKRLAKGFDTMWRIISRFTASEDGSAAIEYSLIAAGIALGVLAVFVPFSEQLQQIYAHISEGIRQLANF